MVLQHPCRRGSHGYAETQAQCFDHNIVFYMCVALCCSTGKNYRHTLQRLFLVRVANSKVLDLASHVALTTTFIFPKSVMADRPGKIAKLQSLRSRLPYVSQSALSAILQLAAQEELPGSCSRKDVRRARDDTVKELTPYGSLHQTITLPSSGGATGGSRPEAAGGEGELREH